MICVENIYYLIYVVDFLMKWNSNLQVKVLVYLELFTCKKSYYFCYSMSEKKIFKFTKKMSCAVRTMYYVHHIYTKSLQRIVQLQMTETNR